jgi:hypothetical protein
MWKAKWSRFSPFSPNSTFSFRERSLLLQFLISSLDHEDFQALGENLSLLPFAFPDISSDALVKAIKKWEMAKKRTLTLQKLIYDHLLPFLQGCLEEEGLVLFLLRRHKLGEPLTSPDAVLCSLYPNGLGSSVDALKENWLKRGQPLLSEEIESLAKEL